MKKLIIFDNINDNNGDLTPATTETAPKTIETPFSGVINIFLNNIINNNNNNNNNENENEWYYWYIIII